MRRLALACLIPAACGIEPVAVGELPPATSETSGAGPGSSDHGTGTGTGSSGHGTGTNDGGTATGDGGIISEPDGGTSNCVGCDPLDLNACDAGHKCVDLPCGNGVGTRCVPIMGDGQALDPCQRFGAPEEGLDDCAAYLSCARVGPDPDDLACMQSCSSTGLCNTGTVCIVTTNPGPYWCWPRCDPFDPACPPALSACQGAPDHVRDTVCQAPADTPVPQDGTCPDSWSCEPGHTCVWEMVMPEGQCPDPECCTRLCDLDAPDCPPLLACRTFFPLQTPPAGLEHVGYCVE